MQSRLSSSVVFAVITLTLTAAAIPASGGDDAATAAAREAALEFAKALEAGDVNAALGGAVAETRREKVAVTTEAEGVGAIEAFRRACEERWGEADTACVADLVGFSERQVEWKRAVIKIQGDVAKFFPAGTTNDALPKAGDELITLMNVGGKWKYLLGATEVENFNAVPQEFPQIVLDVTRQVAKGGFEDF